MAGTATTFRKYPRMATPQYARVRSTQRPDKYRRLAAIISPKPAMRPTCAPLAPRVFRKGPTMLAAPSYVMSANRLTMPRHTMKRSAAARSCWLAGISRTGPDVVAHALARAVSRLVSTPWWGTDSMWGPGRRHECRRGTHECVRYGITTERPREKRISHELCKIPSTEIGRAHVGRAH